MKKYPLPWLCTAYFLAVPPFIFYVGVPSWIDMFFRALFGILWFGIGMTLPVIWAAAMDQQKGLEG